jgi:predicted AlkP superfamily pyrophosphatase or phosphodiesterase
MIILALDALDLHQVQKFNCKNLMQKEHGQTDLSDFKQARTVVLWASFLTGKNLEKQIPIRTQWAFKVSPEQTFLKFFKTYKTIDVPAFSFKQQNHAGERKLLKGYFEEEATVKGYDKVVWKNHEENKKEFLSTVGKFDLVMGYFNLADAIGHLSFGITEKMAEIYYELDKMAEEIKDSDNFVLVISDHGMKQVGRYGDHSRNGFYSFNHKLGLNMPKITGFYNLIRRIAENECS